MKKLFLLLLCLALCFSAVGCAVDSAPEKEQANPSQENSNNEAPQTFGLNEAAVFSNLKFTATELAQSEGKDFFVPNTGNVFVGIKFTIENISNEDQTISSLLLFEGYVDDVKTSWSVSASCVFDEGTLDGTIAPGKKLVGWYSVEVPANWKTLELQVQNNIWSNNSATFIFQNN